MTDAKLLLLVLLLHVTALVAGGALLALAISTAPVDDGYGYGGGGGSPPNPQDPPDPASGGPPLPDGAPMSVRFRGPGRYGESSRVWRARRSRQPHAPRRGPVREPGRTRVER